MRMRNRHTLIWLTFQLFSCLAVPQTFTVSGYVRDKATGENLPGVNIYDKQDPSQGTATNGYGFYSLSLGVGTHTVVYQFIGYQVLEITVDVQPNLTRNVDLEPVPMEIGEVTVTDVRTDENVQTTEMGTTSLQIEEIKSIPAMAGEVDIMKALQLLPGVQSAGEGNTGLYVRGGGPDQNLILLDEAVVYNTGHLFGFFSVFNPDAVHNATLIKGGMPAKYGGRLSSVLDVQMLEGNNKEWHAQGGIGLISSRLTLQGPILRDKSSLMISGRRTYADILAKPFLKGTDYEGNGYYFYDLNAKANFRFSDRDRVYLSGYFGRDVFTYHSSSGDFRIDIPWGNATGTARWNHLFSDKLFMNASLIYNNYDFETRGEQLNYIFKFGSGIRDLNAKTDFDWYLGNNHKLAFGASYTYHTFIPTTVSFFSKDDSLDISTSLTNKMAHEAGIYASYETSITQRFRLHAGLRYSAFQQVGPYDYYVRDAEGIITDTVHYKKLEGIKFYHGLEPRLSMRFLLDENSSIKGSVSFTQQYIHLVSNSSTTLPTDVWVPSSLLVPPEKAVQYALGYFRNFRQNTYETSIELYYKSLDNLIEFKEGFTPEVNVEPEVSFVFGKGSSYGAELFIRKRRGDLTGWIGYTLSRTMRQFDDLNNGEPFPAKYDRTHDLSVVLNYRLNKRWDFGATFVYGTGNAFTMPEAWYLIEGNIVTQYGPWNSYRLANYHRLDLAATLHGKPGRKFQSEWVFAVYNVYNRMNPFFIYFENQGDLYSGTLDIRAKQVSLFPVIPSVSWNFKF